MAQDTALPVIDEAREAFGLTYEDIASAICADNATLYRWREGATPSPVYRNRLDRLSELVHIAMQQMEGPDLRGWLTCPMGLFNGRSPKEMIINGRAETVLGVLLSRQYIAKALQKEESQTNSGSVRARAANALWRAEIDAMFDRMATPASLAAADRVIDMPLRVAAPEHLRKRTK